ncbi:MAG: M3 family oligoendopeptidase, partial [bacterium]
MTEKNLKAKGVRWDISDLYASAADERLETEIKTVVAQAENFAKRYRGKIAQDDLQAEALHSAIVELEAISTKTYK